MGKTKQVICPGHHGHLCDTARKVCPGVRIHRLPTPSSQKPGCRALPAAMTTGSNHAVPTIIIFQ